MQRIALIFCLLFVAAACSPVVPSPSIPPPSLPPPAIQSQPFQPASWSDLQDGWMTSRTAVSSASDPEDSWPSLLTAGTPIGFSPDGSLWSHIPGRGLVRFDGIQVSVPFSEDSLLRADLRCRINTYRELWCVQRAPQTTQVLYFLPGQKNPTRFMLDQPFMDFALDPLGNFWVATESGLIGKLDPLSSSNKALWSSEKVAGLIWAPVELIPIAQSLVDSPSKPVQVESDSQGNILVLTASGGLYEFDGSSWHDTGLGSRLSDAGQPRFAVGPEDEVWVASAHSLLRYDGASWTRFSNAALDARELLVASDGTVWLRSYNSGVFSFDGVIWRHFTASDRLPSQNITTILSSPDGALWFLSDAGWARYKSD